MTKGGYAGGAVALLIALAGCSVVAPTASPSGAVTTPAATTVPAMPSPSPLSGQQKLVTSASHAVRFALPRPWTVLDLNSFNDPDVRSSLTPIAKELGITVDAYIAQLTQYADMIATGPVVDGYPPSITVRKEEAPSVGAIPTMEQAQRDVAAVQGTVTDINSLASPLGPGYAVRFSHPDGGSSATRYGAVMVLPSVTGTAFMVTVDTADAATRDAVVVGMASTIQPDQPAKPA